MRRTTCVPKMFPLKRQNPQHCSLSASSLTFKSSPKSHQRPKQERWWETSVLGHPSLRACTHPSRHHQRHKAAHRGLTSLWIQTGMKVVGAARVRRSRRGLHIRGGARRSLNYGQQMGILVCTSSWCHYLMPTRGGEAEGSSIPRRAKLQCQQLHVISGTKRSLGSEGLCLLIPPRHHRFEKIWILTAQHLSSVRVWSRIWMPGGGKKWNRSKQHGRKHNEKKK